MPTLKMGKLKRIAIDQLTDRHREEDFLLACLELCIRSLVFQVEKFQAGTRCCPLI